MSANVPPPRAARRHHSVTHHGITLDDPFAWLRSERWQTVMRDPSALEPDIRATLEAENAYTSAMLADTVPLQDTLFAEMKARIKEDDSSVPTPDGPWDYYSRYVPGGPISDRLPTSAGRHHGRANSTRRQRRSRRQAVLAARRHQPHTRPCADRLFGR